MSENDTEITATVLREQTRLGRFIRRRVSDPADAEDILQEVFYEFVEAYHLPAPIEHAGAWLIRVARNRIVDLFRRKRQQPYGASEPYGSIEEEPSDDGTFWLGLLLPSPDDPEAGYARSVLLTALQAALEELPSEQREAFAAHEVDGVSFKEMASHSGVPINTLLARKRYAVLHLRSRLQSIYDEFEM